MVDIIVQHGLSGLNDPRHANRSVIVIARGTFSATGKALGDVEQRLGVPRRPHVPRHGAP